MRLIIHRGTHQIGGSCVELQALGRRIVLDPGLPLVLPDGERFCGGGKPSVEHAVAIGIAPAVHGLYRGEDPGVSAVILSHVHQDHSGLGALVHEAIPVYATPGTLALLEVAHVFLRDVSVRPHAEPLPAREPFHVGPFAVTALPVDHSAPDAVALLVEAGGKRVLYSGDLRAHGRKGRLFHEMLRNPPADIDALLLEGTTLGRPEQESVPEQALEKPLAELLQDQHDLVLLYCSAMNLDRLVTVYKVSRRLRKLLVIDLYTAYTLDSLRGISSHLPQHDWDGIRVVPWKYQQERLIQASREDFLKQVSGSLIGYQGILRRRRDIVLLGRTNHTLERLERRLGGDCRAIRVVWSMWSGYWAEDTHVRPFCERHGIEKVDLHTSGHASWADLQELVAAVNPRQLIPIHTCHSAAFRRVFASTTLLCDGEALDI